MLTLKAGLLLLIGIFIQLQHETHQGLCADEVKVITSLKGQIKIIAIIQRFGKCD